MKYTTLYLDPTTHDIVFENGSIRFTNDGEITLQKIKNKLLFFKGDYFLDEEEGVDYLKYIFEKNVSDESIRTLFLSVLQTIPEITEIISLDIIRQKENHTVNISFQVKDMNGNIIDGEL